MTKSLKSLFSINENGPRGDSALSFDDAFETEPMDPQGFDRVFAAIEMLIQGEYDEKALEYMDDYDSMVSREADENAEEHAKLMLMKLFGLVADRMGYHGLIYGR